MKGTAKFPLSRKIGLALGSLLITLLVLELSLRLAGTVLYSRSGVKDNPQPKRMFAPNTVRVLCLGPCFTQGLGAPPESSYPRQLERLLARRHPESRFAVINRGMGGENLSFFVNHLDKLLKEYRPHLVVLNINDRVNFFDENILLANLDLFSRPSRIRVAAGSLLNGSKLYRLLSLCLSSERAAARAQAPRRSGLKGLTEGWALKIAQLEARTGQHPGDPGAWHDLSVAYYTQGVQELALQSIQRAIALEPANGRHYLQLFRCRAIAGEYGPALEASRKGLAAAPGMRAKVAERIARLEEHLRLIPWDFPKYEDISLLQAYLGRYAESLRWCEKALSGDRSQNRIYNIANFSKGMLRHKDLGRFPQGPFIDRSLYFHRTQNDPWVFLNSMRSFFDSRRLRFDESLLDGQTLFRRLLRYDLKKARNILERRGTPFILENMGSAVEQQETIRKVCAEMEVPLADVFQALKDRPDRESLFHGSLSQTLNKEGYNFLAEEILRGILKNDLLDKGLVHAKRP
jgi:tetratricopeptide (TPR) repeat protein